MYNDLNHGECLQIFYGGVKEWSLFNQGVKEISITTAADGSVTTRYYQPDGEPLQKLLRDPCKFKVQEIPHKTVQEGAKTTEFRESKKAQAEIEEIE
jgi:hypothetical protein